MGKNLKYDSFWLGFLVGLLGPVIGFWLFYLIRFSHRSPIYYWEMFVKVKEYQSPILSLSIIFNAFLLWMFLNKHLYKAGRGIMAATFFYVPWILYLYFKVYGWE